MAPRNLYEGCLIQQPIGVLEHSSFENTHPEHTSVSQLDPITLTSYDLLPTRGQTETIVVPGSPAIWSPLPLPQRLRRDPPKPLIREAFPTFPLEPLFRAISITAPETDLNSFDIITDRRNLRLLLNFPRQEAFRIDAEIVGNSLLLSRWIDWSSRRQSAGYGKEFEKAFTTTPDCAEGSLVHKRAVAYTLAGLRILVRFEVDACLVANPGVNDRHGDVLTTPTGHKLVLKGGLASAAGVVEIKTTGSSQARISPGTLSQMWLSRTPILCQGLHKSGIFDRIVLTDAERTDDLRKWEEANRDRIAKLVQILRRLKEIMEHAEGARFGLVCEKGSDRLKIFPLGESYPFRLPQDLRERWHEKRESQLESAMEGLLL